MTESCCCTPEAGNTVCDLPLPTIQRPARVANICSACGQTGKAVQGQTVKALLAVSLREVHEGDYLFCRTRACPVVYFTSDGAQTFTTEQVRERVYQKEPIVDDVLVCYCFRHAVGEIRLMPQPNRATLLDDIDAGIQAGQCACDLRNPQGSCCLGNMRELMQRLQQTETAITH
ncbi:hypothetical protein ANAEL_03540 [Anaerolineales bacterium]|nr:hypothetical protein ANAEL_03540 [Anaerolineales bacterium]